MFVFALNHEITEYLCFKNSKIAVFIPKYWRIEKEKLIFPNSFCFRKPSVHFHLLSSLRYQIIPEISQRENFFNFSHALICNFDVIMPLPHHHRSRYDPVSQLGPICIRDVGDYSSYILRVCILLQLKQNVTALLALIMVKFN